MTWNIQGMWVFLSLAAGLAAMTSQNKIEADIFLVLGALIWILGFSIDVIADNQKSKFRSNPENQAKFITTGIGSTETVTVGQGGAGATAGNNNFGTAGGTSSFGSLC